MLGGQHRFQRGQRRAKTLRGDLHPSLGRELGIDFG
jgi:hypothetical protein